VYKLLVNEVYSSQVFKCFVIILFFVIKKIVSSFYRVKGLTGPSAIGVLRCFYFPINSYIKKVIIIKKCKVNSVICITVVVYFIDYVNKVTSNILIGRC
jgi:hypothetical protein